MLGRGLRLLRGHPCLGSLRSLSNLKRLTASDSEALSARLAGVVGDKNTSLAAAVRSQHGQDEGPDKGLQPDLVVFPGCTGEVVEVREAATLNWM